jgi:CHAT domain-containing protein/tetratricopeptide (TPR) repeat protein
MFKTPGAAAHVGVFLLLVGCPVLGQAPAPSTSQLPGPGLRKLTGEDEKRAKELGTQIDNALRADRWDEAIAKAEQLLALRVKAQGPKHFEAVSEEWQLKASRRVAPMPKEDRVAYESARTMNEQGEGLHAQGKYAQAQVLFENALAIRRRLLTDDHPETAQSYNNLGYDLDSQAKHAQAQPLLEKALEIRRRDLTDSHPDTAESYDNIARNLNAQGKYTQAEPLHRRALEIRRRLLGDLHRATASSYNSLAGNLDDQGKHALAQPFFEKALEIKRSVLREDDPDTASGYDNLATNLGEQGKFAQAQALYEKALAIRQRVFKDDHPDIATSFNNLAFALNSQGKHAQAQPSFEKALAIYRRVLKDDHPDTANCFNNLAINLNAQGKFAQAQPLLEKALETYRRLLTDNHPKTAYAYNNLGFNLNAQGKYSQAQVLYEKALEIYRRGVGDNHPGTARTYNNLAYNLSTQGKYAEAQPFYEKSLEIRRRLFTDDNPDTARTLGNVALNLDSLGKFAQAQPLHEKALAVRRSLLGDDHPDTAQSCNSLAENLVEQGKFADAELLLVKALEVYQLALGEGHPHTANTHDALARNLYAQGKYIPAKDEWMAAARSRDAARLQVAFAGLERTVTGRSERRALAAVLARLGQPAEAWQALEEDLGRGLLDELAARADWRFQPAERARLRELTAGLERLDRLVETTPRGLDRLERAKRFADLKHQRDVASIALGEFQTKLLRDHGALAGQVASLHDVQAALPADAALVAWVDFAAPGPNSADPDGEHWGVAVRSRGLPMWVPIPGSGPDGLWADDDFSLPARLRAALASRPRGDSPQVRDLAEKLRAIRLAPLAKALDGTTDGLPSARKLIVLPSRALLGIPAESLLADDDARTVSYAPSATVFRYLHQQPRPNRHGGVLALGDPDYRRSEKPDGAKPPADRTLLRTADLPDFAPLPGTRNEVDAVARLFMSDDRSTRVLLGADAGEPELDRIAAAGELPGFGYIHLATHAVIDESLPERSAVILTQTGLPDPLEQVMNRKPVFDGRLSVREIQRSWDLKAELVTLSACETALGKESGGEGFVGFTQALLMSGARSVCLSLWKVDDKATSLLMARFYQNLLGKRSELPKAMPTAEALQEAKRWLRSLTMDQVDSELAALERGEVRPLAREKGAEARKEAIMPNAGAVKPYDHPYYWAAFVLVGDPD